MRNLVVRLAHNWLAKLTSLGLATLLWVLAGSQQQPAEAVPRGLPDQSVATSQTPVHSQSTLMKVVELEAFTTGTPHSGFMVGNVTTQPAQVQLSGPASVLRLVTSLRTMPVDVTDLRTSASLPTEFLLPPNTQLVSPSLRTVSVDIPILRVQTEGTIEALDAQVSR